MTSTRIPGRESPVSSTLHHARRYTVPILSTLPAARITSSSEGLFPDHSIDNSQDQHIMPIPPKCTSLKRQLSGSDSISGKYLRSNDGT